MGRSKDEAQRLADQFVANADRGDHAANDQLVRDVDDRDPFVIDADQS